MQITKWLLVWLSWGAFSLPRMHTFHWILCILTSFFKQVVHKYTRVFQNIPLSTICSSKSYIMIENYTVGQIIFKDKKFQGFHGYLVNLENKYPRNFLYILLHFFVQHVVGYSKWLYGSTSNEKFSEAHVQ